MQKSLCRQNMFNFGGADAEGKCPKRSMRCSMRVTTHNCCSWKGETLLWAYDMNNALPFIIESKIRQAEFLDIFFQCQHLNTGVCLFDEVLNSIKSGTIRGRYVVIDRDKRAVRSADSTVCRAKAIESLRRGDLVHHVSIDIDEASSIFLLVHDVVVKNFIVHSLPLCNDANGSNPCTCCEIAPPTRFTSDRRSARHSTICSDYGTGFCSGRVGCLGTYAHHRRSRVWGDNDRRNNISAEAGIDGFSASKS